MNWALWICLLGLTLSATTLAVSVYFSWSFRWRIRWLGTTSEIALAAAIAFGGLTAICTLLAHHP